MSGYGVNQDLSIEVVGNPWHLHPIERFEIRFLHPDDSQCLAFGANNVELGARRFTVPLKQPRHFVGRSSWCDQDSGTIL